MQNKSSEQENLEVTFECYQLHQVSHVETNSGANEKQTVTNNLIEMQYKSLSKLVHAVCEIFNVTRHRTVCYNRKANGCCERQNATIILKLHMYIDKYQKNSNLILSVAHTGFQVITKCKDITVQPIQYDISRRDETSC